MACGAVYSTNVFLKFLIQEQYASQHFVWCSESFDGRKLGSYSVGSLVPPSSNPAQIFQQLAQDVRNSDRHSAKINEQKATLSARAVKWFDEGRISADVRDEITYMVNAASFQEWRPLLYVIPTAPLGSRLKAVPIDRRAGFGPEYIIEDLKSSEFDILEL